MAQKIYLSRHAPTIQNIAFPNWNTDDDNYNGLFNLASKKKYKANILGKYLKKEVNNPIFLSSELERSVATVDIIAEEMGVTLDKNNFYKTAGLNECQTVEQESREKGYTVGSTEWNSLPSLGFVFQKDLGVYVKENLIRVAKANKNNPIIAIGHIGTNSAFLETIGIPYKYSAIENCGLFELEREGEEIIPLNYFSNKELEQRL